MAHCICGCDSIGADRLNSSDVMVRNVGPNAVNARITVRGVPKTPEPAGGNGYELTRAYYDLDGKEVDPSAVKLGDRMVVVLSVTTSQSGWARLVLNDPLPAGFAIDNPSLVRAGDVAALDWLAPLDNAAHTEYQTDRFTVAFDLKDTTEFQFAYMARAIAPGSFNLPAATLEDMYRPERQARTDAGRGEEGRAEQADLEQAAARQLRCGERCVAHCCYGSAGS